MPITWDDEAKAGYLYLRNTEERVVKTVDVPGEPFGLDLDESGRVIGIEFLADVPVSALMYWVNQYATKRDGEIVLDW